VAIGTVLGDLERCTSTDTLTTTPEDSFETRVFV